MTYCYTQRVMHPSTLIRKASIYSKLMWDNLLVYCEDVSLPKVPSVWFNKELNG